MTAMTTPIFRKPTATGEIYGLPTWDTAQRAAIVIVKRKPPTGKGIMSETSVSILMAPVDANDLPMAEKNAITLSVRYPITGDAGSLTITKNVLKDFVSSDAFDLVFNQGREIPEIV